MKTKLKYIKHITENEDSLLCTIFDDLYKNPLCKWINTIKTYLKTLNTTISKLKQMNIKQIDKMVKEWDTKQWKANIKDKKTLEIYKNNKKQ